MKSITRVRRSRYDQIQHTELFIFSLSLCAILWPTREIGVMVNEKKNTYMWPTVRSLVERERKCETDGEQTTTQHPASCASAHIHSARCSWSFKKNNKAKVRREEKNLNECKKINIELRRIKILNKIQSTVTLSFVYICYVLKELSLFLSLTYLLTYFIS